MKKFLPLFFSITSAALIMVQIHEPPGVTIRTILRDLAASRSLDLELLAGGEGLDRRITIPHTQKTGLALSGFDAYLREAFKETA